MDTGVMLFGMVVFLLLVFVLIGGPMVLADWVRKRRQETIRRQIALTEAIDGELGALVAPLVKRPLWGPWQIQISVPFARPSAVGRILAVAHEVLSVVERMHPSSYRIVLAAMQDPVQEARQPRVRHAAKPWASTPVAAA